MTRLSAITNRQGRLLAALENASVPGGKGGRNLLEKKEGRRVQGNDSTNYADRLLERDVDKTRSVQT